MVSPLDWFWIVLIVFVMIMAHWYFVDRMGDSSEMNHQGLQARIKALEEKNK